jgi:predicted transcriptional regulator
MESARRRLDTSHLLRLSRHLTDRDHRILSLLHTHRVLTTHQITQVAFTSHSRTIQRMRTLTGLGLVARFRPRLDRGSAPWHYVIDTMGAHVVAADHGEDTDRVRVRRDQQLSLARSTHLAHRVGVNGFFTALIAATRASSGQARLSEWLNAADSREWVESYVGWGVGMPRPDGLGRWSQQGRTVEFFLEWDNGTETHRQLTAKLERYADFAQNMVRAIPWVLFVFPTPRRESNARAVLRRVSGGKRLRVATAHMPAAHAPEGAVWARLDIPVVQGRERLVDLALGDHG